MLMVSNNYLIYQVNFCAMLSIDVVKYNSGISYQVNFCAMLK